MDDCVDEALARVMALADSLDAQFDGLPAAEVIHSLCIVIGRQIGHHEVYAKKPHVAMKTIMTTIVAEAKYEEKDRQARAVGIEVREVGRAVEAR